MAVNSDGRETLHSLSVGKISWGGNSEHIFIDVRYTGFGYVRCCLIYPPPPPQDTSLEDSLHLWCYLSIPKKMLQHIYCFIDFNLPDICWENLTARAQISERFWHSALNWVLAKRLISQRELKTSCILYWHPLVIFIIQQEEHFCTREQVSILCYLNMYIQ